MSDLELIERLQSQVDRLERRAAYAAMTEDISFIIDIENQLREVLDILSELERLAA